ncbi:MAG TPA: Ig-like domain-containing protein [Streptosporangiaceae bacterium]|nr:Ig-like domain-containing protein [Streptosporangiaceae bacterium]
MNKTESDQGDNVVTFGDEGHMTVVAHLTANGHSLLGTAEIDATNPRNGNVFFVCDITSWDMTSHFGDCSPAANDTLTANNYTLTASYLGTGILAPSVSNSITLTVNPEDSELTRFNPGSLTMTYGSETADQFNFQIIREFAFTGTAPTGTIDVFFSSDGHQLCNARLDNTGSGSCSMQAAPGIDPDIGLSVGSYVVEADYPGDVNYTGDHVTDRGAGAGKLTVSQEASNTSLAVPPDLESGESGMLAASISPTTKGTPTGAVDFALDGQPLCSAMPIGQNGTAACPSGSLTAGTHAVTAHYEGDQNFTASDASQSFAVTLPTTVNLAVSTPSPGSMATYGQEQGVTLKVNVTSPAGKTPTGTVDVFAGSTQLCTITLTSAAGQCSLSPAKLRPGSYSLTASYSGDSSFSGATTPPGQAEALTITREPATTTLAPLTITTVTIGHENREHLTATVKPKFTGITPGGKVTFQAKNQAGTITTLCRNITLTNGKASCTIGARQLRRGTYRLTATYAGSITYTGSTSPTSPKDTLTIR